MQSLISRLSRGRLRTVGDIIEQATGTPSLSRINIYFGEMPVAGSSTRAFKSVIVGDGWKCVIEELPLVESMRPGILESQKRRVADKTIRVASQLDAAGIITTIDGIPLAVFRKSHEEGKRGPSKERR